MVDNVQLVVVHNPFNRRARDERLLTIDGATTVAQRVAGHLPVSVDMSVAINGEVITREEWEHRTLRPGDQLVAVPVLHGGDGGGILGAIAMVVIMVYAPYLAAAMNTSLGLGLAAGSMGMTALTIGISMVGSALVSSLMAPPKPNLPSASLSGRQSYDNSPSYAWQPATTQEPGAPIARSYGRSRLYGNVIAGYIENTGDDGRLQTAHLLVELGQGPYSSLSEFRINEQPLNYYSGVTVIERRGHLNQDVIPTFNDTRATHTINAKVVSGFPVTRATTTRDYDALEIVVAFPQGLWYSNDAGGLAEVSVVYAVEISADGGATWTVAAATPKTVTRPVTTGYWSRGAWFDYEGPHWAELAIGSAHLADHTEGELAPFGGFSSAFWRWISSTVDVVTEVFETVTTVAASQRPIRKTFRVDHLTRGLQYQVRITNHSADQTSSRYGDDLYLAEVNEVLYDDFEYPRSVLVAIKALATDQLSGGMKFDCMVDAAIVRVWNGSAWSSAWSNNPAWVTWDILTQPVLNNSLAVVRYDALQPARLILADFYAWAQFCDSLVPNGAGGTEKRCTFDGTFDTASDMWGAALEVCSTARAVLIPRGTSIGVVWDTTRVTPAQVFTVGNTAENSFRETFLPMADRATSVDIDYVDAATWQRDKLSVVNPAVTENAAARVSVGLRGVTRPSQVYREAMYRLKRNELLRRTAEISVDIDALACVVGDLVWVQCDVTQWGEGGRIVSGTTTSVVLDNSITLASGKTYDLVLRLADDTILTRTITTAPGTVSAVTVGTAFTGTPQPYDVWAIGETGRAVKEFLIDGLSRDGDQRVKLSLIEYNASLYGIDAGVPVIPTANMASLPAPTISGLTLSEGMLRALDGTVQVYVDIAFSMSRDCRAGRVSVAGWATEDVIDGTRRLMGVSSGASYTVTVAPVDGVGRVQPLTTWQTESITVVGKLARPGDVTGFFIAGTLLSWLPVSDIDLAGYALRFHYGSNSDWGSAAGLISGLVTESPYDLVVRPAGVVTLMIKAVDTTGNESAAAGVIVTDLGDAPVANIIETIAFDPAFVGTLTGGTISGGDIIADGTDSFYGSDDQSFYGDDTAPRYAAATYAAMSYTTDPITIASALTGSLATLSFDAQGVDLAVSYRMLGPEPFYGADADAFYGDDADPFFGALPPWLPWPGQVNIINDMYQFRITTGAGTVRGELRTLALVIDAPDIVEEIADLPLDAAGTVIPYTKTFQVIRTIQVTLQANASGAITVETNKAAPLAPTAKAYNAAHTSVSGATADFTLKGY